MRRQKRCWLTAKSTSRDIDAMPIASGKLKFGHQVIAPGDNARLDIQRALNGGATLIFTEARGARACHLSRENAIGAGIALLEAAGVPIQEAYNRAQAAKGAKP
jgi:hypothetical protein